MSNMKDPLPPSNGTTTAPSPRVGPGPRGVPQGVPQQRPYFSHQGYTNVPHGRTQHHASNNGPLYDTLSHCYDRQYPSPRYKSPAYNLTFTSEHYRAPSHPMGPHDPCAPMPAQYGQMESRMGYNYPEPRGGLAPSKSGAFVRYQSQSQRFAPRGGDVEERDGPPMMMSDVHVKEVDSLKEEKHEEAQTTAAPESKAEKECEAVKKNEGIDKMQECPARESKADAEVSPDATEAQVQVNANQPAVTETSTTFDSLTTKRVRSEPNIDDMTPKAGAYRHNGGFFPPTMNHAHPQATTKHGMIYPPSTKRTRLNSDEFYPHQMSKYEHHKYQNNGDNSLRPIRSPTHRRSFSIESECRQDRSDRNYEDMPRHGPASYSPNSLVSRRSFDFYRTDDDDRTLTHSWTNELEGRSGCMSWEVPPALSAICSFGQLNNDSLKSPGDSLRNSPHRNEDDVEDEDMPSLPPTLPGIDSKIFPIAPRPNKMIDRRDDRMEPREYYKSHQHHLPMSREQFRERVYYTRSPHRVRERYHDERYYDDTRYSKPEMRYEERRHEMDTMMVDRRDPYESRRYRRYDDERHQHRSSPPISRDAYFGYLNDTSGGLSSRSFDSRSLGDMDEPMSSLLYRPSFSWERGLDMPDYDQPVQNNILVQLSDQQKIMKALAMRNEIRTIGNPQSPIGLILLLAMPNDRNCLSETLCIIRNNVEVFTATADDINAPAPGRKRPIQVGQVGLRCVYCRMCTNDRVKRAMCFPSSTKRIYRAMIDMKLDHFPSCPYIPSGLKARLEELSASSTRSTGMTVQYFVKSAKEMGMMDMDEGIYIDLKRVGKEDSVSLPPSNVTLTKAPSNKAQSKASSRPVPAELDPNIKRYDGKVLLALEDDGSFLSSLRCFLRRNVCAFTATATDIAVRTPTTFSVRVGQVGVGCVHCLSVPPKQRSNRAVCFPFTVARIYQSVADIQRFHLGECKMMPADVRAEFLQLQSESAKGSRGLATRTYWIDSARKIGLADGPGGMYFSRDPALPPPKDDESVGILAQVATNANTNFKPLVTAEDKPTIADFLYVVMEQLQPCLFTDADRNKRRSKNVGSIGVECKHCAGKIDGRKFFWSSVSAAESNFVSVHSHMMDCKYIPDDFKTELARLKALRREQTSRLKTGSQKAFFTRVWNRLHSNDTANNKDHEQSAASTSKPDTAPVSSNQQEILTSAKSIDNDPPFDSMMLPCGGSSDELRALLESKSTLSSMPSIDEAIKLDTNEDSAGGNLDFDIKTGQSSDSGIAIKNSLSSVAHEFSAVSVRSKEVEQDPQLTAV